MASTQNLTELPTIQYTGMDYSTVISQIKEIIENNSNWSKNWTQFYNSEAGTMLIQLMAWICDNLAVRQDVLYNEQFLATATTNSSKLRLLNQIGYVQKTSSAAIVPLSLEFQNVLEKPVNVSCCRTNESSIAEIQTSIFRFYGVDINGGNCSYEILSVNSDGTINYTTPIKLGIGSAYYTQDSTGKQITAVQGRTIYKEFTSDTDDGPIFELTDSDIDLKTLVVYDVTDNKNTLHVKVDNFMDTKLLNGELTNYIVEKNDNGNFQIRYADSELVKYGNSYLSSRLFEAGHTIGVLYRTSAGSDGNIPANYISTNESLKYSDGEEVSVTIENVLSGYNGEDGESLDAAVKNAPLSIMTMNRAVTIDDYDRILKKSDLVLNCKSFSPENMPESFIKYFGRKINPQEIFSFMVLNKNFNNCPTNKLNYFPWIELNKEPILNEKYVFGDANMNIPITYSNIYRNVYIEDNYAKYKETAYAGSDYDIGIDNGKWFYEHYDYDFYKNNRFVENYKARMIKNFSLFKTSEYLGSTIKDEKASKKYEMKVKIHEGESDSLYISNINNSLSNTTTSMGTSNNVFEIETNAQYTSLRSDDIIDCINYKYIKFVLDDNLVITVDLQQEKNDVSDYDIGVYGNTGYVKAEYLSYYLKLTNNPEGGVESYWNNLKNNYTLAQAKKMMMSYINSKDFAKHRKGILELLKEAVEKYSNFSYKNENAPEMIKILSGTKLIDINSKTAIYKYNDQLYVVGEPDDNGVYSKIYDTEFNSEKVVNETESDYAVSKQEYTYRSVLANGSTAFVDIGLQEKKESFGSSRLETVDGIFYDSYVYNNNGEQHYSASEKKIMYTLKINDKIYAFRIDAYTAIKALEMYDKFKVKVNSNSVNYYDYFTYLGKGDLYDKIDVEKILANNELGEVFSTISAKYPGYFSRGDLKTENILLDRVIKTKGNEAYTDGSEISYIKFSLGSIATTLEYLVSPFNTDKDTVYMFVPNADGKNGAWLDIKNTSDDYIKNHLRLAKGVDNKSEFNNREFWVNIEGIEDVSYKFKNSNLWNNIEGFNYNNIDAIGNSLVTQNIDLDDIYNFRNILNGKLRIRSIKKANFDTNKIVNLNPKNITNVYDSTEGIEWDIRFEYINGEKDLRLSSVAENEYSSKTSDGEYSEIFIENDKIFGKVTDLIQSLIGYRRQYDVSPVDYVGKSSEVVNVNSSNKLLIKSLNKGENSSLYFVQTAQRESLELMFFFGLTDGFCYTWNAISNTNQKYFERARSNKAYGYRRIELYIADDSNNEAKIYSGVPYESVKDVSEEEVINLTPNVLDDTLKIGDILVSSNDINYSNSKEFYLSFVLKNSTKLQINKHENFYYSDNEETNEYAKPEIVGIEGEAVEKNENGEYEINISKSKFGVKLTKNTVDTNSYYSITQDTYNELNSIENEPVKIETNVFDGLKIGTSKDDVLYTQVGGAGRGLDTTIYNWDIVSTAVSYEVPVILAIDGNAAGLPQNRSEFVYNSEIEDYVIIANPGPVKSASGNSLYNALLTATKEHNNELINKNYYSLVKKYYNTTNKVVISGLSSTDEGCIVFYYPDKATGAECFEVTDETVITKHADTYDLAVKLFYRNMFGTNITNPDFYNLYPREYMVGVSYNEDDNTDYLNDEDVVCYLNSDHTEYFYCPTKLHHLKFVYRGFVDFNNKKSQFGDYFVTAQARSDGTFNGGYNFFINKTKYSSFPDCPFYLHFINDRTYEYKRTNEGYKTEQDTITEYMQKYKITGTDLYFLKPYFKSFDIAATINYNANYDLTTIKNNVESALSSKYKVANVSDISVGETIYRSDIFKIILGIDGVESAEISYFGYDYSNQSKYPDQKYSLSIDSNTESTNGSEFYIISVLAENDTNHGLILNYKKSNAQAADV